MPGLGSTSRPLSSILTKLSRFSSAVLSANASRTRSISRPVAATPTSAWINRFSRSSRNDWSTFRPNHERTLKSWAVLASPFLNRSSQPEIAISVPWPDKDFRLDHIVPMDSRQPIGTLNDKATSPAEPDPKPSRRTPSA